MTKHPRRAAFADPNGEFPLDLPTWFFHLFVVIARHRDAKLDKALRPLGLNVSRHRALSAIALTAPCTMTALAEFSAVDRTTMTRTVDQLVRAALVERTTPANDRRQVILTPTDLGRRTYRQSLKIILGHNRDGLAGLPEDVQRQAIRALEVIAANIIADPELAGRLLFRSGATLEVALTPRPSPRARA